MIREHVMLGSKVFTTRKEFKRFREREEERWLQDKKIISRCLICKYLCEYGNRKENSYIFECYNRSVFKYYRGNKKTERLPDTSINCTGYELRATWAVTRIEEVMKCMVCSIGKLIENEETSGSCSYDPEGHAGIFRRHRYTSGFKCDSCGVVYDLNIMCQKAHRWGRCYLSKHNL